MHKSVAVRHIHTANRCMVMKCAFPEDLNYGLPVLPGNISYEKNIQLPNRTWSLATRVSQNSESKFLVWNHFCSYVAFNVERVILSKVFVQAPIELTIHFKYNVGWAGAFPLPRGCHYVPAKSDIHLTVGVRNQTRISRSWFPSVNQKGVVLITDGNIYVIVRLANKFNI